MPGSPETIYVVCAVVGGAVLILQTVMLLFGGDSDTGGVEVTDHDIGQADSGEAHEGESGLSLLSVRTVSAFLAFFGLAGWYGTRAGWGTGATIGAALGAGAVMLVAVARLFSLQHKLTAQGNLNPAGAVGATARVYLRIPAANSGKGKIQVVVQGRTAEFSAFTKANAELQTGSEVRVLRQVTADTFEVEPIA